MIPPTLLVHEATVEPYRGAGSTGDLFASPVQIPCYFEGKPTLVLDSDGQEVLASGTLFCDLGWRSSLPIKSRVTVAGGTARVVSLSVFDTGGLAAVDHLEVALR